MRLIRTLLQHRPQQHRIPMVVQEPPLPLAESADVHDRLGLNTHPLQRRPVRYRRHHERAIVLEADEAAIKQVADAGR